MIFLTSGRVFDRLSGMVGGDGGSFEEELTSAVQAGGIGSTDSLFVQRDKGKGDCQPEKRKRTFRAFEEDEKDTNM